jgi:hypothetical protein
MADRVHLAHISVRAANGELILSKNVELENGRLDLPELRGEAGKEPAQMGYPTASSEEKPGSAAAGELSPTMKKLLGAGAQ